MKFGNLEVVFNGEAVSSSVSTDTATPDNIVVATTASGGGGGGNGGGK